jgi:N-acetylmuramoyl-L-alanine amidase
MGEMDRVKRRLLRDAVADNVDTIRGGPPRALRRGRRVSRLWLRRLPFVLAPLTLIGSGYLASNATAPQPSPSAPKVVPLHVNAAAVTLDPLQPLDPSAFPLTVKRIVIDAGHGGSDPGASSPSLLTEKDITLDIAARLRGLLTKSGFDVLVTRGDDRLVPLRERARIANRSDGDIFVSIHVNSVPHPTHDGIETYYLGPTTDPSLTKLAAAENGTSGYSLADLRTLLDRVYADARRDESHRLAEAVQTNLYGTLRTADPALENWGVKRAPFVVLMATEMPAVLAEVGCLSNEHDAGMLRQPQYRQRIAEALLNGIRVYAGEKGS